MDEAITIYCDGLCEPVNPGGHACYGWVAYAPDCSVLAKDARRIGQGLGMTNNVAEYEAVLEALRWAFRKGHTTVRLLTDSQLVVNQVKGTFACNAPTLKPLLAQVKKAQAFINLQIEWIPREQNTEADELSRYAYEQSTGLRARRR